MGLMGRCGCSRDGIWDGGSRHGTGLWLKAIVASIQGPEVERVLWSHHLTIACGQSRLTMACGQSHLGHTTSQWPHPTGWPPSDTDSRKDGHQFREAGGCRWWKRLEEVAVSWR